ncbi:MAG: SRPBCC domain-containing protein [Proteobacteria bacterium]|nr:SRPBCC domain-containing protein [Pseudomonadota bacterium]
MKNLARLLLVLGSALSATTALGEVILIAETGFIVENKIQLSSDRRTTWRIFTQQVNDWWPADHTWWGESSTLTIDEFAGGCFCEKNTGKSAEHMRISFVDPPSLMRMTGGLGPLQGMGMYGALEWVFESTDQGTNVTMTYRVNGINPDGFAELAPIVDAVQAIQLGGLGSLVQNNH